MLISKKSALASVAGLAAIFLLVSGCNQPAPLTVGGTVDLSVQETKKTSGTDGQSQASGNRTEGTKPAVPQEQPEQGKTPNHAERSDNNTNKPLSVGEIASAPPAEPASAEAKPADANSAESKPADGKSPETRPVEAKLADAKSPEANSAERPHPSARKDQASSVQAPAPVPAEPAKSETTAKSSDPAGNSEKNEVNMIKQTNKPDTLTFQELYSEVTVRGIKFSDKVNRLAGKKVEMSGYMAPPLAAKVDFFVLTKVALTICPFCSSDADWPQDIVVVFMPKDKAISPTDHPVKITGTLSIGSQTDDRTGFVSLVRIMADKVEVLK